MSSTMTSDLTLLILRAALFMSLAVILLLAIRRPLRRWLGAGLAYQAWLIVPAVTVAALLPGPSAPVFQAAPALRSVRAFAAQAAPAAPAQADALLLAWACGMLAMAAWFVFAHRTFMRQAGRLTLSSGVYLSDAGAGPASVGLFRPIIIVPQDFHARYSPLEQALVIAHEQTHIARRDALANLLAALFQCVFWFNPLVHIGARCFRQDQEIACDAIVMQRHPRQRRAYAEALLKFHSVHTAGLKLRAGIHCHWQNHHPTRERLMSLQLSPSGTIRRLAGRGILALLAAGAFAGTLSAHAEQSAAAPSYAVAMTMDAGGEQSAPRVLTRAGEKFAVASGGWRLEMMVRPAQKPDEVWLTGKVLKGGDVISAPTLLARLNEKATIKVGDADQPFTLSMVVSPQP
jgi:beta-lactamase regulating signal transducer with metallopeptidase domain